MVCTCNRVWCSVLPPPPCPEHSGVSGREPERVLPGVWHLETTTDATDLLPPRRVVGGDWTSHQTTTTWTYPPPPAPKPPGVAMRPDDV